MTKENFLRRSLYTGAGFVGLVVILFPLAMVLYLIMDKTGSATPGPATVGIIVFVIIHLLILYSFREALIVNKRNGHMANVVYIISGIFLLIFALIFLIMVLEFMGYHTYYVSTAGFFFCLVCDFFAAMIALTAIFLQPKK